MDSEVRELNVPMTQTQFAGLVGVSQKTVSLYLKRGIFAKEGTALEWCRAYCAHLRKSADARHDSHDDYKAATLRLKKADAELMELKVSQLESSLVSMSDLYAELEKAHDHAAQVLSRYADKMAADIQRRHGIEVDSRLILNEMNGALSELKRVVDEGKASATA